MPQQMPIPGSNPCGQSLSVAVLEIAARAWTAALRFARTLGRNR